MRSADFLNMNESEWSGFSINGFCFSLMAREYFKMTTGWLGSNCEKMVQGAWDIIFKLSLWMSAVIKAKGGPTKYMGVWLFFGQVVSIEDVNQVIGRHVNSVNFPFSSCHNAIWLLIMLLLKISILVATNLAGYVPESPKSSGVKVTNV